jgi:signal transduction histidine kinase
MFDPDKISDVFTLVCLGFSLLATIYHTILYIYFRDKLIFNYALYLLSSSLFLWMRSEIPSDVFGQATRIRLHDYLNEGLQIAGFTLYINFGIRALGLQNLTDKAYYSVWQILRSIMLSYAVVVIIFNISGGLWPNYFFISIRILIFGICLVLLCRLIIMKKSRFQELILLGCTYFFLTTFMSFVANTRANKTIFFDALAWLDIGYMGDIVFFSVAIGYWIKSIFDEKQAAVLEVQREKFVIQQMEFEKNKAIVEARVEERNRISMDIHDDLGSGLTKIAILGEITKTQLSEPDKAKINLESISNYSRELVDNLQNIIWVLNAENDTLATFAAYLREYVVNFFDTENIRVGCHIALLNEDARLSEVQRRNLFLVIKETCNNITKHANCNEVVINLEQTEESINIHIRDNGTGFKIRDSRAFGNGLKNMKERLGQIGGSCEIRPKIGEGTDVNFRLPFFCDKR